MKYQWNIKHGSFTFIYSRNNAAYENLEFSRRSTCFILFFSVYSCPFNANVPLWFLMSIINIYWKTHIFMLYLESHFCINKIICGEEPNVCTEGTTERMCNCCKGYTHDIVSNTCKGQYNYFLPFSFYWITTKYNNILNFTSGGYFKEWISKSTKKVYIIIRYCLLCH